MTVYSIRLSEKTPVVSSTIVFDIVFWLVVPSLLFLSWPHPAPVTVFVFIILTHIGIAIVRYGSGREIIWPPWVDLLAVLCGVILAISAVVLSSQVYIRIFWLIAGLVLCYGHICKILDSTGSYYFEDFEDFEEKTTTKEPEKQGLVFLA